MKTSIYIFLGKIKPNLKFAWAVMLFCLIVDIISALFFLIMTCIKHNNIKNIFKENFEKSNEYSSKHETYLALMVVFMIFYSLLTICLIFDIYKRKITNVRDEDEQKSNEKVEKFLNYFGCYFLISLFLIGILLAVVKFICLMRWYFSLLYFAFGVVKICAVCKVYRGNSFVLHCVARKLRLDDENAPHDENSTRSKRRIKSAITTIGTFMHDHSGAIQIINAIIFILFIALLLMSIILPFKTFTIKSTYEGLKDDLVKFAVKTKFFICPPEGKIMEAYMEV
jgi:amino acid transporter